MRAFGQGREDRLAQLIQSHLAGDHGIGPGIQHQLVEVRIQGVAADQDHRQPRLIGIAPEFLAEAEAIQVGQEQVGHQELRRVGQDGGQGPLPGVGHGHPEPVGGEEMFGVVELNGRMVRQQEPASKAQGVRGWGPMGEIQAQGLDQLGRRDGLDQEAVEAHFRGLRFLQPGQEPRQGQDGQALDRGRRPDPPDQLEAIHVRQVQILQDQVGGVARQVGQGRGAVGRLQHPVALALQGDAQEFAG